ncbi:MAG: recombinase family protein [Oricola sp.]|nr:MAG: recombinase family protein [Oricola sp.]
MTRVVLYARYSSDNQRDASIEDQLRLCREHAERHGWTVVDSYTDRAMSGASLLRPGIQELIADAPRQRFGMVLAESLDRISRDQEDIAGVYKRMTFAGVKMITVSEGEISELHVGLKGTMGALYLKDLADKTRRGLRGRVEDGKSGGGLCYGYDVVKTFGSDGEPERGERSINEAEAAVVERIFREFAAGISPRAIAKALNAEKVPGPGGRPWMDTTVRGHGNRGTGILNNELYVGRLVWNRMRYLKDPDTGRRVSRMNPRSEWIINDVPELRILDDALWQRVKGRQAEIAERFKRAADTEDGNGLNGTHRRKYLLSGMLTCAVCGGKYTVRGKNRYGCSNHYNRGTCDNSRTIAQDQIETRVLDGLRDKLMSPELVAEFVREFQEEANRAYREARLQEEQDRRQLEKIERGLKEIVSVIEEGRVRPALLDRLDDLESQKADIAARLKDRPAKPFIIHPNIAEIYREKVAALQAAIDRPDDGPEAREAIRSLIEKIILEPGKKRGEMNVTLYGELGTLLAFAAQKNKKGAAKSGQLGAASGSKRKNHTPDEGVWYSVVAGAGFEPATFRL